MMASSSSSSLCDNNLLQDDLPWPSMPFAPALHTFGLNHQWSQPLMLSTDQFISYEVESLQSVQGHLQSQLAAAPPTLSPHQAHQLSTVLMMQELGFQWSSCAAAAYHTIASSMNNVMNEEELRRRPDQSLVSNPRSSSSCGTTTTTTYTDMVLLPHLVANLDGAVLPSINVSRLQKPAAGDEPPQMLAASCKRQAAAAAASVVGHSGIRDEHVPWPYGPRPHLIQGSSMDDTHTLQMKRKTNAAATAAQGRGGRHGSSTEHRSSTALPPSSKKPRLESRSSSSAIVPSFKVVRKEKLGDRIAALQQLVSPFGKTDTASVLMEAIGYIKFLQDQVETLSGPYLRSSKNSKKACRAAQQLKGALNGGEATAKIDLRSRGLCLVPLSCTSYVTNENGVWPPPNFRGN